MAGKLTETTKQWMTLNEEIKDSEEEVKKKIQHYLITKDSG